MKNEAQNNIISEAPEAALDVNINARQYSEWIVDVNNQYVPHIKREVAPVVPPGKYSIVWNNNFHQLCLSKEEVYLDELLEFPNTQFSEILKDIDYFWDNKQLFEKYKFVYKRGILLHGPAGCGKSCLTALLSEQVIKKNGIVISIKDTNDLDKYHEIKYAFRSIQKDTPLVLIFEDLDGLVKNSNAEVALLNILDGTNQTQNILHIGCTNYPELLKDRILNRPSRFDRRYKIDMPTKEIRKFYFEHKIRSEDITRMGGDSFMNKIINETEGLSLAHLSELIRSIFIFGNDVDESIKILKDMNNTHISSTQYGKESIGFTK